MKLFKYSLTELKEAIKTSTSIRQTLMKLNVAPYGGNYAVFRKAIAFFEIDTSHFLSQGWSKGKTLPSKRNINEYLTNKYLISSHKLRLRLLKEKLLKHQCSNCKRTMWLGSSIPLELHHIDGNSNNNNLNNLKVLCPNCHAFTSNYRGKNKK